MELLGLNEMMDAIKVANSKDEYKTALVGCMEKNGQTYGYLTNNTLVWMCSCAMDEILIAFHNGYEAKHGKICEWLSNKDN